jgi:GH25 family lysozyme M1 (1,4-beta-N-acetylmuramidase)
MAGINRKLIVSVLIWIGLVSFIIYVLTMSKGESPIVIKSRLDSLLHCQTPEILKVLKYKSSIAIDDFCDSYTIQYTKDNFESLMANIDLSKWQGNDSWKQ